ncbi:MULTISPECIES: TetR family transcriptional regulator [Streptomyces]|uniref:Transcriptional regulator, TetR family n=2 Tax=Streptomyces TaxID=1883 RepID=A0A286DY58_9ACTN|nr:MULTISPECIES: TetR family transcriptional regulator [Streptomyces]TNM26502.1 TetR/AcrR family transcriptional regulator [Streptomyces sedi]SOD63599.1 transcriptional regulator, TetR family [Streptomyces zhaozhouensis]
MTGKVTTVDGRVAGRRGQATRQKLLDCLAKMLSGSPYRDVKVIDVARKAGTSPATFYQYFPDVEAAVLELAEETVRESAALSELVTGRSWTGKAGAATADKLVDGVLAFWRKHDAILRVIELGAAEGDRRFVRIRTRVQGALVKPLTEAAESQLGRGRAKPPASPAALAGSLVTMLGAVSAQSKSLQSLGAKQSELKPALSLLVHLGVTGRKPTK